MIIETENESTFTVSSLGDPQLIKLAAFFLLLSPDSLKAHSKNSQILLSQEIIFKAVASGKIRRLWLWSCGIKSIARLASNLGQLEYLDLDSNQISDISSLKKLRGNTFLEYLGLNNNRISD